MGRDTPGTAAEKQRAARATGPRSGIDVPGKLCQQLIYPPRDMGGFTKLHSSLIASSIWNESDPVRIVWVTMLAMADSEGDVKASVIGLAHQARKTIEETKAAIEVLEAPDQYSGRKELEGRRIVPIEGGWHLVTHEFYRELGMSEETKRYWRDKKRDQRKCPGHSKTVKDTLGIRASGSGTASVRKGESEGKGKPTIEQAKAYGRELGMSETDVESWFDYFESNGWRVGGKAAMKDWKAGLRNGHRRTAGFIAEPRLTPQQRQARINKLNERKQAIIRRKPDNLDFTDAAMAELKKIDAELQKL